MGKTVFILGAGFSVPAGLPPQSNILARVFADFQGPVGQNDLLFRTESSFYDARLALARFLIRMFSGKAEQSIVPGLAAGMSETEYPPSAVGKLVEFVTNELCCTSLEDLFTIVDKAITSGDSVYSYRVEDLSRIRSYLVLCILRVFSQCTLQHDFKMPVYQKFSNHILDSRLANPKADPVAVITTNWDCILDTYLARAIAERGLDAGIDYCIYDYDYGCCTSEPMGSWCPSTLLKRTGRPNIKLLKLHGAINWITCTNCHRLFYSYEDHIGLNQFSEEANCPYCEKVYEGISYDRPQIALHCHLATPTMIKNIGDDNFRNIWKNAFVELTEAAAVVFIGYSLPQADYELRYVLKRAINPRADISVVLSPKDDPGHFHSKSLRKDIESLLPASRFDSFFGTGRVKYYYGGLEGYVDSL